MTGPEHYREAERLLDNAADAMQKTTRAGGTEASAMAVGDCITATAQVHAILAQTALLAVSPPSGYLSNSHAQAWAEAVSS